MRPRPPRVACGSRFRLLDRWLAVAGAAVALAACAAGLAPGAGARRAGPACDGGSLYIAAHEDDPLLFMLPAITRDIAAGRCVEVVILTAGDAGQGQSYWQEREAGLGAALAVLAGLPDRWWMRDAGIPGHPAPRFRLFGHPQLSMVFLQLPDGRSDGAGFGGRGSMEQLWEGTIPSLTSLAVTPPSATYQPSTYTSQDLVDTLRWLMLDARPRKIGVQDYVGAIVSPADHADHRAGARFALAAAQTYPYRATFVGYQDYQILDYPPDLGPTYIASKEAAWFAYLPHDRLLAGTCLDVASCLSPGNYGNYWSREYTIFPSIRLPVATAP